MTDPTRRILPAAAVEALPSPSTFAVPDARYRGLDASVSLSELPDDDVVRLRGLYDVLLDLHDRLAPAMADPDVSRVAEVVSQVTATDAYRSARQGALAFGSTLDQHRVDYRIRQAYHDLRGGALAGLILQLDLVAQGRVQGAALDRVFLLARDHLKMMRNAVHDLDPERHAADLQTRHHPASLLEAKWSGVVYHTAHHHAEVQLFTRFQGAIAERCMEFAALDRVLYNLVNNATRFAFDQRVELALHGVERGGRAHVRLAVVNRVEGAHAKELRRRFDGDDLGGLFTGGFTTGGHGLGMRIAAEFVTRGYGLRRVADAVSGHYVGARLLGKHFVAWVHWPAV
jgi:signal transduction histidine kinase